jgi:hypothetical protein
MQMEPARAKAKQSLHDVSPEGSHARSSAQEQQSRQRTGKFSNSQFWSTKACSLLSC